MEEEIAIHICRLEKIGTCTAKAVGADDADGADGIWIKIDLRRRWEWRRVFADEQQEVDDCYEYN